ncbi:MAG: NAD(+) synthase [Candidatus Faecousia sp.]|jgi:NAD+ synthase|uniref:NAD(+) synthase n=1 Tax=Faecousia sp. TaxID=2952921 RepID=UPI002A8E37B8|nr:NAD(+) synthase [Candidatus Faecousia sp.]
MKFDAKKVLNELTVWIRDWFEENGRDCNAIVGISGGKDSSVAAALCVRALGVDRVIGVLMPNGEQSDIAMSRLLVEHLGIRHFVVNIHDGYQGLLGEVRRQLGDVSRDTEINLAPRLRMATLYAVAQSNNGRVANTCNLSEDWVGYSTRYGDSAGDFSPLSMLCVREVKALGRELGLPECLVEKVPIDGLCGQTDEEKLGFTYATLDAYIRDGVEPDAATKARIDRLYKLNRFKVRFMDVFPYRPE